MIVEPHVEADEHERGAREERNAPAEREELLVGEPVARAARKMPPEKKKPTGAPSCGNMPYQARFPGGAFSIASSTAPPHSPPSPRPWPNRHSASSSGAATPIDA